jgi:hypothetical protein
MPSPYEDLNKWVTNLTTIRGIAGEFNYAAAHDGTPNEFAKKKIGDIVTDSNKFDFLIEVRKQFNGIPALGYILDLTQVFGAFTNDVDTVKLGFAVRDFVTANCGFADLATPLSVAYPAGIGDTNWKNLINGIHSSNLDAVLAAQSADSAAGRFFSGLNAMLTAAPPKFLLDLVNYLTTIQ